MKKTPNEKAKERGYVLDKCPKCKKEMRVIYNDFADFDVRGQSCGNKNCWFYGIRRSIFLEKKE